MILISCLLKGGGGRRRRREGIRGLLKRGKMVKPSGALLLLGAHVSLQLLIGINEAQLDQLRLIVSMCKTLKAASSSRVLVN